MSETIRICETCREQVDPEAAGVVRAVEVIRTVSMGPTVSELEGLGVYFHEECFPAGSPNYRRVEAE